VFKRGVASVLVCLCRHGQHMPPRMHVVGLQRVQKTEARVVEHKCVMLATYLLRALYSPSLCKAKTRRMS
jgi:hypothetical protein